MEFSISRECRPDLLHQPINSRSYYDAYRRSHDCTRIQHEGTKKGLRGQHEDVVFNYDIYTKAGFVVSPGQVEDVNARAEESLYKRKKD